MRKSEHLRHYGKGISIAPTKINYKVKDEMIEPHVQAMIDLVDEYVANNVGDIAKPLCMKHTLCRKLEGHE
jgi:hypothetical protein